MESLPSYRVAHALPARSVLPQAPLAIRSMEISTVTKQRREITDDELELIEMRYQQSRALRNLETLFAEGLLNR
jgi:hypothetical protein